MIAPVKPTPRVRPRRSALETARLAVADALLAPRRGLPAGALRPNFWRMWLVVLGLFAMAIGYALGIDWWTIEKY